MPSLRAPWRAPLLALLALHSGRAAAALARMGPSYVMLARPTRPRARAAALGGAPPTLVSLRDALGTYDALLLDQFGVLHDGERAYAGATEAMRELQRALRKRIVILSNSSKRRLETVNRLHALGLGMCTWLDGGFVADDIPLITVVTSGDIVWNELRDRMRARPLDSEPSTPAAAPAAAAPAAAVDASAAAADAALFDLRGAWCVVLGNGDDDDEYVGTAGCIPCAVGDADFVLARGLFELRTGRGDAGAVRYDDNVHAEPLLRAALARGLPMLVANPDLVRPDGKDSPMPGRLAARYAAMGGDVRSIGKPHARVYRAALEQLAAAGVGDARRVVAVGDSMSHDILGARRAGLDAVLITGGVHAAELGVRQGEATPPEPARLAAFLAQYPRDEWPTHVCAGFVL